MNPHKKKALGKGLEAILGPAKIEDAYTETHEIITQITSDSKNELIYLSPTSVVPSKYQTRKKINEETLQNLADSIKKHGLQEPILVRKKNDTYELICGERRVRASILAGVESIPAICRDYTDEEAMLIGLIENIQREELNPIEEAEAYQSILNQFHWSQEQLAETLGKDRSTIANALRLLTLPEMIQQMLIDGNLSPGHARALLRLTSPEKILQVGKKVVNEGLSVRETEILVNNLIEGKKKRAISTKKEKNHLIIELEQVLCRKLGTKVTITPQTKEKGKIEVKYFSNEDLTRILNLLGVNNF